MSSSSNLESPRPFHLALVEISCGEDNTTRIRQVSCDDGARDESSFHDMASASRHLAAVLQRSVQTLYISGHVLIGGLFDDTRRSAMTVSVRLLLIDPKTVKHELSHVPALLECFRFNELVVHGKGAFAYAWKVPPTFITQSTDDVYEDLTWIPYSPGGIPREFFSIPSVERLEHIHICPNINKWNRRRTEQPPQFFLAFMRFIFEQPPGTDYSRMEPLEVWIGSDKCLPVRFVDDVVEKFRSFAGGDSMLPFTLRYSYPSDRSLNNIWRSAAENAVKLCPKNAALKTSLRCDVLYDSYHFPNVIIGKTMRVDVRYPEDQYPKEVCGIRFTILDAASDANAIRAHQNELKQAKRCALPNDELKEVLLFLERFDIDACQLTCRRLSLAIESFAPSLPLHCISMVLESSSYEDEELNERDVVVNPWKPDGHKCNYLPHVHPSLPEGHYVRCSHFDGCNVIKATVGATVKLMRREDPHVCSTRLGAPYRMAPRIVRYVNAIAQDDSERLREFLRLTANSIATSVFFSWTEAREFVTTNAFITAWRKALEMKDGRRMRLQVRDLMFSYCSIAALTPKNFVQFFCDELEVIVIAPRIDAAEYNAFFKFDSPSRNRWNAFRKRND